MELLILINSSKKMTEIRKLQVTGGSTYIVSLPKKWITQNQLNKGSTISISEDEDGTLLIMPSDATVKQKSDEAFVQVSPKESSASIIRKTVSTYLVGYNLINIRAEKQQQLSSKQRNEIRSFVRHMLVGTEIVTDTPSQLTLQVLLSYPELSVQSALRRMCIITSSMHKDAITALKELDHQTAKGIITTDNEVDRFNLYIVRQLKMAIQNQRIIKEIGLTNARDCLGYRLVTKSVERTADHAANIAENVLALKQRPSIEILEKVEEMSTISVSMFETAIEALFKQDFNLAESVIEKTKDVIALEKEIIGSFQKTGSEEGANLRLIIESIRRTAEYASDIAEVVLNLTITSVIV
jgi:phosphate uptake regulator